MDIPTIRISKQEFLTTPTVPNQTDAEQSGLKVKWRAHTNQWLIIRHPDLPKDQIGVIEVTP